MFLPKSILQRLALGSSETPYRRLHVPLLIQVTQDAGWIRRLSRNPKHPIRRPTLRQIVRNTWTRERFHTGFLVFYVLCSIDAAYERQPVWCLVLLLTNLFYNLYPIWLQQHLRLRVSRCLARPANLER